MTTRYAVIGAGHRAQMYLEAIRGDHAEVASLVAVLDVNPGRAAWHRDRDPAFADAVLGGPEDLETVIRDQRVDRVIVTSVDRFHAEHVVRALEAGADVVVEKPLTIDAASARSIRDAVERTGREVVVTFNYRYSPRNSALKEVIDSGRIGRPVSMVFEWVLDVAHGADYFRRWHRDKANSGGLFIHKASHHIDLACWWLDAVPTRVYARGGLRFYGADAARSRGRDAAPARGTHDGDHDPFELDLRGDDRLRELYLEQEQHDGYRRDQDVFGEGVTTEDNLTAIIDFDSQAVMTYALNAHSPWEGYRVVVNGTEGRAELEVIERSAVLRGERIVDPSAVPEGSAAPAAPVRWEGEHLLVQRHFEVAEEVEISRGEGSHGGGDALMLAEVFRGRQRDPLGRAADYRDGLRAVSVGICGNESLVTGTPVDVAEFLGIDLAAGREEDGA